MNQGSNQRFTVIYEIRKSVVANQQFYQIDQYCLTAEKQTDIQVLIAFCLWFS